MYTRLFFLNTVRSWINDINIDDRSALEAKAKLYEQMSSASGVFEDADHYLVDFERKAQ